MKSDQESKEQISTIQSTTPKRMTQKKMEDTFNEP